MWFGASFGADGSSACGGRGLKITDWATVGGFWLSRATLLTGVASTGFSGAWSLLDPFSVYLSSEPAGFVGTHPHIPSGHLVQLIGLNSLFLNIFNSRKHGVWGLGFGVWGLGFG